MYKLVEDDVPSIEEFMAKTRVRARYRPVGVEVPED